MTSAGGHVVPVNGRCAICGEPVEAAELAPALSRLPESTRVPLHASCLDEELRRSRARQAAWTRSVRGRATLAWLRVSTAATMLGVVVLSIVVAGPMAIWLAIRGWRLRVAVNRSLGANAALVLVGRRGRSDADTVQHVFTDAWVARRGVVVRFVDCSNPTTSDALDAAVWTQWRSNDKVPGVSGVIFVPKRGRVARWSLAPGEGGEGFAARLEAARAEIERMMESDSTT